ncbi:MAG: type I-C CRISPR-associated protein Cas8c/Csd1 [Polaromonas sp.]|nr:type I-C CRISPR-associated protein Cas8c/Csd1 [Polaromonas sp.]
MILQALNRYYERAENMPREGWVRRGVDYVIVLDYQGHCVNIELIGEQKKGKTVSREMLVPSIGKQAMKHTNSGNDANLLWDNASFVFGTGNKGAEKISSFISTLQDWLGEIADEGVEAVVAFCTRLQSAPESVAALIERFALQEDFEKRDPVLVFRLVSDVECIHVRPAVRLTYEDALATTQSDSTLRGNCLVTGKSDAPLAPNESVIKGVWGGQPAGCNIVSFNARAFESYGKRDRNGENAPVSLRASFAYTTALNHLLASTQRIQVGDASTVFWADRDSEFESAAANIFGEPPKDDPDRGARAVQALLSAVQSGKLGGLDDDNRFHVLGLAPNAARISVRFYHCLPLRDLAVRILQHFKDLEVVRGPSDPQYPSLFRLLAAVAVQNKADNIPPNLGGAIVDAVFAGPDVPYPSLWLNAAVGRCRAEQTVNYLRAAAIKACLNRQIRRVSNPNSDRSTEKEFLPMLDLSNTNPAYRLGRLFAALEKIQEEASPGLNATIRDRYYGAASSTPVAVFTTLLRLKNSHLKKLSVGRAMWFEKLLGEILSSVTDFQKHLPLPDQGRFALGYYHQRQDFFTKKPDDSTSTTGGNQS